MKSDPRIANRAHHAGAQIVEAADVIDDRERGDVVEQRVDGEIAAEGVFFRRAKCVVAMEEVRIGVRCRRPVVLRVVIGSRHAVLRDLLAWLHLAAEGRDLDDLLTEFDVRKPESPADDPAVPEQFFDLIGMGRCPDVEVFRPSSEQQVAYAAADEIGDVVALTQSVENLQRIGVNIARGRACALRVE